MGNRRCSPLVRGLNSGHLGSLYEFSRYEDLRVPALARRTNSRGAYHPGPAQRIRELEWSAGWWAHYPV